MPERHIAEEYEGAARAIFNTGCIKFGQFTLASGLTSPFYVDLRRLRSFPEAKWRVVLTYEKLLDSLYYDLLADVPTSATPLVASLSDSLEVPQITPRMDVKDHGSGAKIDGVYNKGQTAVVVDDLITTARSKLAAIHVLTDEGLLVRDVVVLIDREQGGREQLEQASYNLHAAFTMTNLMRFYAQVGLVTLGQLETVINYLTENNV